MIRETTSRIPRTQGKGRAGPFKQTLTEVGRIIPKREHSGIVQSHRTPLQTRGRTAERSRHQSLEGDGEVIGKDRFRKLRARGSRLQVKEFDIKQNKE